MFRLSKLEMILSFVIAGLIITILLPFVNLYILVRYLYLEGITTSIVVLSLIFVVGIFLHGVILVPIVNAISRVIILAFPRVNGSILTVEVDGYKIEEYIKEQAIKKAFEHI